MPYVANGRVVEQKPFSIVEFFFTIIHLIRLFFASIFSATPIQSHTDSYNSRRPGHTSRSGGSNIHRFAKPAMMGGCSGGG